VADCVWRCVRDSSEPIRPIGEESGRLLIKVKIQAALSTTRAEIADGDGPQRIRPIAFDHERSHSSIATSHAPTAN